MQYNKRLYSLREFYTFLKDGMRSLHIFLGAKIRGTISQGFINRIMLAVTEVNGCEICSYFHTANALKEGMSEEAIHNMLCGNTDAIPVEESVGIYFVQHYAESKGRPDSDALKRLAETYDKKKASSIIAAARMIMIGNTHGIAAGALWHRITGRPVEKSSLWYELRLTFGIIPLFPAACIHALFENVCKHTTM